MANPVARLFNEATFFRHALNDIAIQSFDMNRVFVPNMVLVPSGRTSILNLGELGSFMMYKSTWICPFKVSIIWQYKIGS